MVNECDATPVEVNSIIQESQNLVNVSSEIFNIQIDRSCTASDIKKYAAQGYKVYVINLPIANARREAMVKQLDEAGIEYEIFNATDGYKVKIKNLKQEFFGSDIKNGSAKIEESVRHKITCNPDDENPLEFNYEGSVNHKLRTLSAGEIGIWCSYISIWKDAQKNGHTKIIIFEDDIVLKGNNPKQAIDNFVTHVPENFDLAYLDLHQVKGSQFALTDNEYVNKFSDDSFGYGTWSIMYSNIAIQKLLSLDYYTYPIDDYLWSLIGRHDCVRNCYDPHVGLLTAYVSSVDLLDTLTLTGDYSIHAMGRM